MFVSHSCTMNSRERAKTGWRLLAILLAIVAMPTLASAQTTSDLFEKAVYADETAGDLDKAIKLYGQVIAKTKKANSIAAEAQYRLGLCFEKQEKPKQAREAFQAVVDDFPQEAKFVTLAKKHLPGALELLPVPWKDGEQSHMRMKMASGMEIGTQVSSVRSAMLNGQPVWRCSNRVFATINGVNSFSEAFCDKETFAPLQSYWVHSMLGSADAKYAADKVTIDIAGRDEPMVLDFTDPTYDNEQGVQLFRRLPLEVGLHTELPIVATLMGNIIPLELDVKKKESITTTMGTFDCFKMELNIGQTFWISDDANRYMVRFEAGGITADLTRVEHRQLDESLVLDDDEFSLTLPGRWTAYTQSNDADDGDQDVYLLDRESNAQGKLRIVAKDSLDDEHTSPQVWVETSLEKIRKKASDFKFRGEGVSTVTTEGREVATVIVDFNVSNKARTGHAVAVFGEKSAATMQFFVPTDQYDSLQGEIEKLVRALRVK